MFQFTHPGRGATVGEDRRESTFFVSIHAPQEGCDADHLVVLFPFVHVSIHAPQEGCDLQSQATCWCAPSFNSRTPGGVRH